MDDILPDMESAPLECPLRSTDLRRVDLLSGSFRLIARAAEGEGGGGIATELGNRARGVPNRAFVGVPEFDTDPCLPARGVYGEPVRR